MKNIDVTVLYIRRVNAHGAFGSLYQIAYTKSIKFERFSKGTIKHHFGKFMRKKLPRCDQKEKNIYQVCDKRCCTVSKAVLLPFRFPLITEILFQNSSNIKIAQQTGQGKTKQKQI